LTTRDRHFGFLYFLRDEEHFGAEVHAEMAATYYRVTTFTLHHHTSLSKLCEEAAWVFDLAPREVGRKLDLLLGAEYVRSTAQTSMPKRPFGDVFEANLEGLGGFAKNSQITIRITAWPSADALNDQVTACSSFGSCLRGVQAVEGWWV
jgi:hypothetical protein